MFSIAGAIGRVAIVTEEMLPANTNQALAIIRISNKDIYLPYITVQIPNISKKKQLLQLLKPLKSLNLQSLLYSLNVMNRLRSLMLRLLSTIHAPVSQTEQQRLSTADVPIITVRRRQDQHVPIIVSLHLRVLL